MRIDNDSKILSLYQSGRQHDALSLLMSSYQERLYWHIRRIVMSHDDADDVLQNTLIKIWKGLENFKGDSQLYTWMFRIASNETFRSTMRSLAWSVKWILLMISPVCLRV